MKKLKLFSLLMLLFVGIGQMWGTETQITVSENPTTNGTFTISAVKSTGSNAPIVTGSPACVRCYANNKITISAAIPNQIRPNILITLPITIAK